MPSFQITGPQGQEIELYTQSAPEEAAADANAGDENSDMIVMNTPAETALSGYSGGKYYTPQYTTETFYTPWGKESLDIGLSYLKNAAGVLGIVLLLVFAVPYVVHAFSSIIHRVQEVLQK